MNYYQTQKEEKTITIMKILESYKEVLAKLDKIESKVGIENILPFYDELIDIILMGVSVDADDLDEYYIVYSNTYVHARMKLRDVFKCLLADNKPVFDKLHDLLPWYLKLWTKIKKLLHIKINS